MNDTFDDEDTRAEVFNPAGTSFQGDSVFVFNHCGVVGYIQGQQSLPYTFNVTRPEKLYCATALEVVERSATKDVYMAPSYDDLVDGPVMYSKPDTARFNVEGVDVLVALCHPRDKQIANAYAESIHEVCKSIGTFLPDMPVDRYAFLLYLYDGDTVEVNNPRAMGALEHSYSSFYFWRFASRPFGLKSVAAHEFLHILMPLNLHSKEIAEFNFREPKWSGHLWLYEGVTEYFANQSLLRGKSTSESNYLSRMKQSARRSRMLPDTFSLYGFSTNVIHPDNQRLFPVIYQYGPLNALCLDILIREETDGDKGLLEVAYELTERFGPDKPFDDSELCGEIADVTSSAVGDYCNRYIYTSERVPLKEMLPKIGWKFLDSLEVMRPSLGVQIDWVNSEEDSVIIRPKDTNPFGIEDGDILVAIDGEVLGPKTMNRTRRLWRPSPTNEVTIVVRRGDTELTLQATPEKVKDYDYNVILEDADASDEAIEFRKLVFYGED